MEKSDAVVALAALAQDSRLDIFRLLVQAGPEGLAAGLIGERLALPAATLSFHLTQLRQAGLVAFLDLRGGVCGDERPAGLSDRELLPGRCVRLRHRCC